MSRHECVCSIAWRYGNLVWYAVAAAVLYGTHQIFTCLASDHIGDGLGGFISYLLSSRMVLRQLLSLL